MYGKSTPSEAYQRYAICKAFGWDYYTYMSQPMWFIEEIVIIMNQEGKKQQSEAKKNKAKSAPKTPRTGIRR